jgi:hypothetical protein
MHRDGLVIARSAIPGLDEQGLFTVEAVPPGHFLGVFTGVLVSKEETDKLPRAVRNGVLEWAMAAGNGYVGPRRIRRHWPSSACLCRSSAPGSGRPPVK